MRKLMSSMLASFGLLLLPGSILAFQASPLLAASRYGGTPYKAAVAQEVFDRLVEARGDGGMLTPQLAFVNTEGELASFSGRTVYLGEKAYDVCVSFGADSINALAALLSHELIHYYSGHTWEQEFSRNFAGSAVVEEIKDDWLEDDVQADVWGGLLAYSAGFRTAEVLPDFLPALYDAYGKKEDLPGYPVLAERIDMARNSGHRLQTLLDLFETANYLVALERYDEAVELYNLVLAEGYRSRELYNNLGVYHVLAAVKLFPPEQVKWGFPVELDAEARISRQTRGGQGSAKEQREAWLAKAKDLFEKAYNLDEQYAPALVNLGCVHLLLGISDPEEAELHWLEAKVQAIKAGKIEGSAAKVRGDAMVVQGILAALQDSPDKAATLFTRAGESGSPLGPVNLAQLQGNELDIHPPLPRTGTRESIENLSLDLFLRKMSFDTSFLTKEGTLSIRWGVTQEKEGLTHSRILTTIVNPNQPNKFAVLHLTASDYPGSTQFGIKIGSPAADVAKNYLTPDRVVELATGQIWVYESNTIFFRLEDGQVAGWGVYREKG